MKTCIYCGISEPDWRYFCKEHFIPKWMGRSAFRESNILVACSDCNGKKQRFLFRTVEECRLWLHSLYWSSRCSDKDRENRFNGEPPSNDEKVAASLIWATAKQATRFTEKDNFGDANLEWGSV